MELATRSVTNFRRPSKSEQLRIVSEEAEKIWLQHNRGDISSEQAAEKLGELKQRYQSLFDRILAL